uniref:Uncharacterized protein n=1 Tax=Pseudomonas phage Touem01 TaxID=3138548 RepID=A0AAU6W1K8_9VIRU
MPGGDRTKLIAAGASSIRLPRVHEGLKAAGRYVWLTMLPWQHLERGKVKGSGGLTPSGLVRLQGLLGLDAVNLMRHDSPGQ